MSGPTRPTPSGLTPVEIAVLRSIEALGGAADAPHVRTLDVLERVDSETGVGRRYSERILADLVATWVRHLPLVDGHGNFGSVSGDGGAEARYTEVRLSDVGALALASERGDVGPLPLDLVEGSLYRGGSLPPFDPATTLQTVLGDAPASRLLRTPTGTITADPAGPFQRQGRWMTRYQLGASIRTGLDHGELVITSPAYLVGTDSVLAALVDRAQQARYRNERDEASGPRQPARPPEAEPVPFRDLRDEGGGPADARIVLRLVDGVDVIEAVDWVRAVWPVTVHVDCSSYEETYDRFAAWRGLDQSGVRALHDLVDRVERDVD